MFYGLKLWFEIIKFFVVAAFLCLFCLDKCFSMIWMMDDSGLC